MSDARITCPVCKGGGELFCHVNRGENAHSWGHFPCPICKGEKTIAEQQLEWMKLGGRIRKWREKNNYGLREFAEKIGIKASRLSAVELGSENPSQMEEWIPSAWWQEIVGRTKG